MNSRNLCIIFLGGIFLSLPSELFSLPLMQLNSSLEGNMAAVTQNFDEKMTAVNQSSTSVWKLIEVEKPRSRPTDAASASSEMPTEVTIAWTKERKTDFDDQAWKIPIWGRATHPANPHLEKRQRIAVVSNPDKLYIPNTELSTVCMGTPIPYGEHKVMGWLYRHNYKREHNKRRIYIALRREIFYDGNSELCHNMTVYGIWVQYLDCALRRNQRLEGFVPKYPLHQIVKG